MEKLFEIGKKYKIVTVRDKREEVTFITLRVEDEDDIWVRGKDRSNLLRGIKKSTIIDYNLMTENRGENTWN